MGRVYDADELASTTGQHGLVAPVNWLLNTGRSIPCVRRVEFDDDADRGAATVTAYLTDVADNPLCYRNEAGELRMIEVTFRVEGLRVESGHPPKG